MKNAFIPENLSLEEFLSENPPAFKFHIDKFKYIISLITVIPANNKDLLDTYDYVPINAQMLKHRVHDYKKYIKYLLDHDIFETDNHYIVSEKSKGFRFKPQYRTPAKIDVIKKFSLRKESAVRTRYNWRMEKKYSYLYKWFDDGLQIDYPAARDYLQDLWKSNLKSGDKNATLKFNVSHVNVLRLKEHDYSLKVDRNVHRFHTNLTRIKKELRNLITYDGQPMVAVDISNSQPCFTIPLLNENFYTATHSTSTAQTNFSARINTSACGEMHEHVNSGECDGVNMPFQFNFSQISSSFKYISSSNSIKNITSYIMMASSSGSAENQSFKSYKSATQNGMLYEHIQSVYESKTGVQICSRKEVKAMIFSALFSDNRFIGQPDAATKRVFRSMFPDVYTVFAMIKRKDKSALARLLQMMESSLMLDHVAKRISKEQPDMPIFTIHDSIVCPVGNEEYVARVIREEMMLAIGVTPSVKFEVWKPENIYS